MNTSSLLSISPLDGRYSKTTENLNKYFSEAALIKYRIYVEVEYLLALRPLGIPALAGFPEKLQDELRDIYRHFNLEDAARVKEIEQTTNHDVKAVEYFLKEKLSQLDLDEYTEYIHFGLTSQDINNTAIPLSFKEALENEYFPAITKLITALEHFAAEWKDIPMLAHTHGQPASPTKLGKEFMVFAERLSIQLKQLQAIPHSAKFGGATGNFNAHNISHADINWVQFANSFVSHLGLQRSQFTTQIEHYDNFAAQCDALKRINNIIIDLCRDVWQYISMNYFTQKIKEGEIGSSAMPHKVNPIDFENAEGNAGLANALFEFFAAKLPISRLQRDLTDSTVLRNIGVPFGHSIITISSVLKGLNKLLLNTTALNNHLNANWAVVAEAIQTVLRREKYPKPYEALKALTRGNTAITQQSIAEFINQLNVAENIKEELRAITPHNYTGVY